MKPKKKTVKKLNTDKHVEGGRGFLPRTQLVREPVCFIFINGGLGDYINFMSSILWVAKENPHVIGHVIVKQPFQDVAKFILKDFKNWSVEEPNFLREASDRYPHVQIHYPRKEDQLITAIGAHLMDLGFMYYARMSKPPEGYGYLPEVKYTGPWKWPELEKGPYAVFTPGATARSRVIYGQHFNELTSYTLSRGITPVFLGKRDFVDKASNGVGYNATYQTDYDLTKGIDLTEKTTLLEAIQIMSKACFVIGLDNGLLHFAGTTKTPIIFGHNVATVEHREIRRRQGQTINVHINEKDLACIGCQSHMRYLVEHNFNKCLYETEKSHAYKCLDLLFSDRCGTWKSAIDHVINLPRIASHISSYDMSGINLPSP